MDGELAPQSKIRRPLGTTGNFPVSVLFGKHPCDHPVLGDVHTGLPLGQASHGHGITQRLHLATLRKRLYETLQYFDKDFPNHPNTLNVFLMIAEMALKIYKDSGTGTLYLEKAKDYDESVQEQKLYKQLTRLTL